MTKFNHSNLICLKKNVSFIFILLLGFAIISNAQSTQEFKTSTETVVAYSDVPGLIIPISTALEFGLLLQTTSG